MSRHVGAHIGRATAATAAVCLATVMLPLTASAHSDVIDETPGPGEVLTEGPVDVSVTFSEELDPSSTLTVLDAQDDAVATGGLDLDDLEHVTLQAQSELSPGRYSVTWSAVSVEDGDTTDGSWSFAVADASGAIPEAETDSGSLTRWLILGLVAVASVAFMMLRPRRRRETRVASMTTVTLLALAMTVMVALPASAHGTLESSEPAEGTAVDRSPDELRLWISEPVSPRFSSVEIQSLDGTVIPIDGLVVEDDDGRGLLVVDLPALEDGTYSAAWTVLSQSDGHITRGLVVFGVGSGVVDRVGPEPAEPIPWTEATARWVGLFAIMALVGAVMVASVLLERQPHRGWARTMLRWCVAWASIGAVAGLGLLISQAVALEGTLPDTATLPEVSTLLVQTTAWGRFWAAREVLLVAMGGLALLSLRRGRPRPWTWLAGLGAALLFAQSMTSHGAGVAGQTALGVTVDALHLAAASVWVGGLATVVMLRNRLVVVPWRGFSAMAAISVGVLLATGLFSSGLEVESVRAAVSSAYGRTLIGKIGLFALVALIGGLNAALLNPWVSRTLGRALGKPAGWVIVDRSRFGRLLVAELALGVLVVGATGLLTSLSPAKGETGSSSGAAVSAMSDVIDDLAITLAVQPNRPGDNVFVVHAASSVRPASTPIERVLVRFTYLDEDLGITTERMAEVEPGRFRLGGSQFGRAGEWGVDVVVRRRGLPDAVASFDWTVPSGEPGIEGAWSDPLSPITSLLAVAVLILVAIGLVVWALSRRRVDAIWDEGPGESPDVGPEEGSLEGDVSEMAGASQ